MKDQDCLGKMTFLPLSISMFVLKDDVAQKLL